MRRIFKAFTAALLFGFVGSFVIWAGDPCYYHPYQDLTWSQGQYPYCESRNGSLTLQPLPLVAMACFGAIGFTLVWKMPRPEQEDELNG